MTKSIDIALEALYVAAVAIKGVKGISEVSTENDNDSGEIIFTAGKLDYILRLEVSE